MEIQEIPVVIAKGSPRLHIRNAQTAIAEE